MSGFSFTGSSNRMDKYPKIGVGVIVTKNQKILLGKRRSSLGAGCWQFPGGHLEFNESVETCAKREVSEETGLTIQNIRLGPFTNDIFEPEGKHYVTLFVIAEHAQGVAQVTEPQKCERWEWFDWDNLPQPLFLPIENLIMQGFDLSLI